MPIPISLTSPSASLGLVGLAEDFGGEIRRNSVKVKEGGIVRELQSNDCLNPAGVQHAVESPI